MNVMHLFAELYKPDDAHLISQADKWEQSDAERLFGMRIALFDEFMNSLSAYSFDSGLLRFFTKNTMPNIFTWNSQQGWKSAWGQWGQRLIAFSYDWLGRQIVFDLSRRDPVSGEPLLALFEPGTGEILMIPATFSQFVAGYLLEDKDDILAVEFYQQWLGSGGISPTPQECIGYKQPLFLGGVDDLSNLEKQLLEVYIHIMGQVFSAVE